MFDKIKLTACALLVSAVGVAQEVEFTEYDLDNGLHVILHQDNTAPVVSTSVMYHVGGKDLKNNKTGFAHFFEHLLFEGTKNIGKGEFMSIINSNGGSFNATTSLDRTYYYETFPSNKLELGLWLESERMLHPVIGQEGVETQNEVVKEERRRSYDNRPYGNLLQVVQRNLFTEHPYKDPNIGYMEDLDAATLEEFNEYFDEYYAPNNATLVVAGDIDIDETKKLIEDYFGAVPSGNEVSRTRVEEKPINNKVTDTFHDPNIQLPMFLLAYRTPGMATKDAQILDMVSTILSGGKSSRLYKKLVDDQKQALQVSAINLAFEDYSAYAILSLPLGETKLETLKQEIDEEIIKLQNETISEREFQKLQNTFENRFVNANSSVSGIAESLATYHVLHGNTDLINEQIEIYRSITPEDIKRVANEYLNENQRAEIYYLPKTDDVQ
ncbi:MAG: pitrilysin family protein [Salegentibacter sp.]|uniref:Predicted Zn-dependent peptidase n=1 Tax=Salegentibacter flavus TaxID=287099 RepID=A0A1I4XK82_9FLAO|nr:MULTISPECIES: pitrilysin family protein [Salegentibacter]MDR9455984.1 pitrilysin family protein [Salegentibacter sp.]SFN26205.1 Predicted Zn-dependent peptidase [Salegentibacter flavus]